MPYLPVATGSGTATVAAIYAFDQLGPFTATVAIPDSAAQFTLTVGTP